MNKNHNVTKTKHTVNNTTFFETDFKKKVLKYF